MTTAVATLRALPAEARDGRGGCTYGTSLPRVVETGTESEDMSFKPGDRTLLPRDGIGVRLAHSVRRALRGDRRTDKELARDVGVVPRAVSNWRNDMSLPGLESFFRLCMELPELRAEALRLLQAERQLDPDHERDLMQLYRAASNLLERQHRAMEEKGPPR